MWAMMQKFRIVAGSVRAGTAHCHPYGAQPRRVTSTVDAEALRAAAAVQALERRDVAVVAAAPDDDVPLADRHPVRRVVRPPAAEPDLDPGVALAGERLADGGVLLRVQVAAETYDAGRPTARSSATVTCAMSWQTPLPCVHASMALVATPVLPGR